MTEQYLTTQEWNSKMLKASAEVFLPNANYSGAQVLHYLQSRVCPIVQALPADKRYSWGNAADGSDYA